jgi:hypothetical protein
MKLTTSQLQKIIKEELMHEQDEYSLSRETLLDLDKHSFSKLMKDAGDGLPLEEVVIYATLGDTKIPLTLSAREFYDKLKLDVMFVGKFSQFSRRTIFVR